MDKDNQNQQGWHNLIHVFLYGCIIDYMLVKIYLYKGDQNNINEHRQLGQFIYFITLINQCILWIKDDLYLKKQNVFEYDMMLVLFLFFQFLLGNNIFRTILQDSKFVDVKKIKKLHRFCAFVVYFIGKIKIYFIISFYLQLTKNTLNILFTLYLLTISIVFLIILGYYEKNIFLNILPESQKRRDQYEKVKNNIDYQSISQNSQTFHSMDKDLSDIEISSKQATNWFVFDNKIYDNRDFNHPGGNFITKTMNKRDITRYVFGNKFLIYQKTSSKNKYQIVRHTHDYRFFKYIKNNYLGPVNFQQQISPNMSSNSISSHLNYQQLPLSILLQESIYQDEFEYNIVKSIKISQNYSINVIQNQNKQKTNSLNFYWISRLGQYLRLYDRQSNNTFMECCWCLNPNFIQSKLQMLDDSLKNQYKEINLNLIEAMLSLQDTDMCNQSKYIIAGGQKGKFQNKNFAINGPQGFNCFGFSGQSSQNILIIVQNTEILKFLDLFEILIQRILIQKGQINPNFHKDYLLEFSNDINIDFVIIFDQSFDDLQQFGCFQLNQLLQLQAQTDQNMLKIIRNVDIFTKENLQKFDFLKDSISQIDEIKIRILQNIQEGSKVIWSIDDQFGLQFLQELNLDKETFETINFI